EGDPQADPEVHGGEFKAVYGYPSEHYPYWEQELGTKLPWGAFGENLTFEGLIDREVLTGDRYRVGTAELVATTPRLPCFKLAMRHQREDMVELFLAAE